MAADGVRRALAFATSAYSSFSSCRQYLDDIDRAREQAGPARPAHRQDPPLLQPPGVHRAVRREHAGRARDPAGRRPGRRAPGLHRAQRAAGDGGAQRAAPGRRPVRGRAGRGAGLVAERVAAGPTPGGWCTRAGAGRPSQPWLEPDVLRPPRRAGQGGRAGRGDHPGRVRVRPHGGQARPRHRGGGNGRGGSACRSPARPRPGTTPGSGPWSVDLVLERLGSGGAARAGARARLGPVHRRLPGRLLRHDPARAPRRVKRSGRG